MYTTGYVVHAERLDTVRPLRTGPPVAFLHAPHALRFVIRDLRDRGTFALSEAERARATGVLDRGGRIMSLAALAEGKSCGFRLRMDDGGCAEWHVGVVHLLAQGCLGAVTP